MNTLGQNIKAARVAAGLTQEKLAEKVIISSSSLSHYENDRGTPSPQTLKLIAEAVGKSVDELTNPEGETGEKLQRVQKKAEDFPEIDEAGKLLLRRIWKAIMDWNKGL